MGRRLNTCHVVVMVALSLLALHELIVDIPGHIPDEYEASPFRALSKAVAAKVSGDHTWRPIDFRPHWSSAVVSDSRGYGSKLWKELEQRPEATAFDATRLLLTTAANMGTTLSVVQVGACDGAWEKTNDPMQELFQDERVRAVAIEPVPPLWDDLRKRLETLPSGHERLLAVNAAVCLQSRKDVPFYTVSKEFVKDHPHVEHWAQRELGSFQRKHLKKHRIPSKYIEEIPVQCMSPMEILSLPDSPIGGDPTAVDALLVDAEGLDAELVAKFLETATFRPALLIFEWKHIPRARVEAVLETLKRASYVYWRDKDQIVAILAGQPPTAVPNLLLSDW